ncbi:MAG: BACON domain-containing protein, partial [Candidatus Cryptobacteroides sp.]
MKKIFYFFTAAIMLFGCQRPYELKLDFALNRTDLHFKAAESKSYFQVYCCGNWTVSLESEADWVTLSAYSGYGNTQVNVSCPANEGNSRWVNIVVSNDKGEEKKIYLSQEGAAASYILEDSEVDLLSGARRIRIGAENNLEQRLIDGASISVTYAQGEQSWIGGVVLDAEFLQFDVAEFQGTQSRSAEIEIAFPTAKWDECKTVLVVNQSADKPRIEIADEYELDPSGIISTQIPIQCNWNTKYYDYDLSEYEFDRPDLIASTSFNARTNVITVTPVANYDTPRTISLTCKVKDETGSVIARASGSLKQAKGKKPLVPKDLTEGYRWANCYIVADVDSTLYSIELRKPCGDVIAASSASVI